jgi:hypothetical protein
MMHDLAAVLTAVIWAAVAVYAIRQAVAVAGQWAPLREKAIEDAWDMTVPEDLLAVAMQYPEAWAQEDMMKVIREKYDTLRDWNLVRAAFGVGRIDA